MITRTPEGVAECDALKAAYYALCDLTVMCCEAIESPHYEQTRDAHIAWLQAEARVWGVRNSSLIEMLYPETIVPESVTPAPLPHETDAGRVTGTMTTWRDRRGSIEYAGGVVWCDASDVLGFTAFNLPHLKGYRVTFTLGAKRTARRVVVDEFQASLDAYARVTAQRAPAAPRQPVRPVNTKRRTPQKDSRSIMQHIKAMDEALKGDTP